MFVSYIFPTTSPVKLISNALSHVREELETVEHRTASFTSERVRSCLPEASQFVESAQTLILTPVSNGPYPKATTMSRWRSAATS